MLTEYFMIAESLSILNNELKIYLNSLPLVDGAPQFECDISNFATRDEDDDNSNDKIIQTLVRIEEETTLKNLPNDKIVGGRSLKSNPIIHLNLFVLFISNYGQNYEKSLKGLSEVIKFFQGKYHFNAQNSDLTGIDEVQSDFKLWLNLHTPTFEETNHLWSMMGGKLYPSVMYKVKMIAEERSNIQSDTPLIQNIEADIRRI